jgi:hypothetical protein
MVVSISLVTLMVDSGIDRILTVQTGLLFSTFTLRSILSPGREIGQTLIEVSIIGLYILQIVAAVVLLIRVVRRNGQEKK